MTRESTTRLDLVVAECQSCAWRSSARNAAGTAPRHHDTTGHVVNVTTTRTTTYGDPTQQGPSLLDVIAAIDPAIDRTAP